MATDAVNWMTYGSRFFEPDFPRDQMEAAVTEFFRRGVETRDWNAWIDLFAPDAIYIEHETSQHHGREAIRSWLVPAMASMPSMTFPVEWWMIEGNRLVTYVGNAMPGGGDAPPMTFMNITVAYLGRDGQWLSTTDVLNTAYVGQAMVDYFTNGGTP
jgi:uncharacterized protein (TIGR02246 family)